MRDGDKRPYGKDIQLHHLRKGIVGDWRNHDWTKIGPFADSTFAKGMDRLGYPRLDEDRPIRGCDLRQRNGQARVSSGGELVAAIIIDDAIFGHENAIGFAGAPGRTRVGRRPISSGAGRTASIRT